MKNIHLLPTNKPTKLFKDDFGNFIYSINIDQEQNHFEPQHIYITSDEEIKEGEICIYGKSLFLVENIFYNSGAFRHLSPKIKIKGKLLPNMKAGEFDSMTPLNKIILTTDQDLIKDGVQAIDDKFLEWFVKNPSCEWVEVNHFGMCCGNQLIAQCINCNQYNPGYKIIIPKEEPKQETVGRQFHKTADMVISVVRNKETLEEAAENYVRNEPDATLKLISKYSFKDGAEWMQERMYSEEEVLELILKSKIETSNLYYEDMKEWFEQFKKK